MSIIKQRPGAVLAIILLIIVGISSVVVRTFWSTKAGRVSYDRVWQISFDFQFDASGPGAVVYIALPVETAKIRLLGQKFIFPGMQQARLKERTGNVREAVFQVTRQGSLHLKAEFQVHASPKEQLWKDTAKEVLSADDRDLYLRQEAESQFENRLITDLFKKHFANETDKNKLVESIADFCEKRIVTVSEEGADDAVGALTRQKASTIGCARAMIALFRAAKIPARLITGFVLEEQPNARPHYWVEILWDKKWAPFDPENGHRFELPYHFLAVRRGGNEILRLKEGSSSVSTYTITHISFPVGMRGEVEKNLMEVFDLSRLPLSAQASLIMLLLLPLGALITTFFRNVIGIQTFGTFSPTLLALATVYADWRTVIIIFTIVIVVGIAGRSLLPGLKLMRIPRLSMVFTVVAMTMAITVSLLEYMHFNPAGHVVLLPLVVLTTIIDRVYTVSDEDGVRIALKRLGWTLGVALTCFLLFRWQPLGRLLVVYPELHFITLAMLLLLGLYNQKKLSDVPYFHFLAETKKNKTKKSVQ